ncbi:hypothetical protein [Pantoea stewartii]|uniref:hypothetical protein n=1 Tax=Pantoea stewartii TaxID=66269 RepID=UPI00113079A2|nr:hypothetical protein [Pantoea stewartii]KAB0545321.1 hypothetical protein F7Q90_25345 [Pantoea stewartii subsp. stewartii]
MKSITYNSHSRLVEIEKKLKLEKPRQIIPFVTSILGGNFLKVTNNNGSSFVMPMPRGDSPIIEGLAARKAEANSFNKAFSHLLVK